MVSVLDFDDLSECLFIETQPFQEQSKGSFGKPVPRSHCDMAITTGTDVSLGKMRHLAGISEVSLMMKFREMATHSRILA